MFRRFARKTLRYLADFEQIKGVLAHAGQGALRAPENRKQKTVNRTRGKRATGGAAEVWGGAPPDQTKLPSL